MPKDLSRRDFLRAAMAAGTAVPLAGRGEWVFAADEPRSANEKLNLAIIGVEAKGRDNLNHVASENIVALCDIDAGRLAGVARDFPRAKTTDDFRAVLDLPGLDGVVISTPDHMHALPTAEALRRGLAVYCEKPLTHTVREARLIGQLAAEKKVATQMGTQIHAGSNYRRVVEMIQQQVIGPVNRVFVWQSSTVPACRRAKDPNVQPPAGVSYDLWLGPAAYRPFDPSSFHFQWRWWWDFGGGVLADMACHYMDLPFWALGLAAPTTVVARGEKGHDGDNEPPARMQVDYRFPARGEQPPVHLTWYHGGWMPEGAEVYQKSSAVLFEGTAGRLLADYGTNKLFVQEGTEARPVKPTIPDSVGHWKEWIDAVKTGAPTTCEFGYASRLTEAVLLGNVSYRAGGQMLEWNAPALKIPNARAAEQYLSKEYRKGWDVGV